jgi:eukaryotic-like serine/threonine-protein kinase
MNPNYQRIKQIYFSALELPPESRSHFIASTSLNEQDRQEVQSLLEAALGAASFLDDTSAISVVQDLYKPADEKLIGEDIGGYKIVKEIGRGGMGVVYLAQRQAFQQSVAIKIIKRGMDTDAIVESFVRERQILAALNHRYIANLLDGGTTSDGRPYFVMEFINGTAIDRFCSELDLADQLQIFLKVCSAVSFAHSKLIVHRDLKPSNILIDAEGHPKLLDFGIAKLLDADERTLTRTGLRAMTPEYASPEQMSGDIVGTETDVYSLGKVLQKVLQRNAADAGRKTRTRPQLPSDLVIILAKALHKDSGRRYSSVEAFAEDLRRYLANKPVTAKPDSLAYRAEKFVKRNRLAVSFGAVAILMLIGGLAATMWKAREARAERALAERRFENLRRISDSLITEVHSAIRDLPGSLQARQLLLSRAKEQLDALAEESGENDVLTEELGRAYYNLAELPDMDLFEKKGTNKKAVAAFHRLVSAHPDNLDFKVQLARAELTLADTSKMVGSMGEAYQHCRSAVSVLEQVVASRPGNFKNVEDLLSGVRTLSYYEAAKGDFEVSLQTAARAKEIGDSLRGSANIDEARDMSIRSHMAVAAPLMHLGRYAEAEAEVRAASEGLAIDTRLRPNDTSLLYRSWVVKRRLALIDLQRRELRTAIRSASEALSIMQSLLETSPRDAGYRRNTGITHLLVGEILFRSGKEREAMPHFTKALELAQGVIDADPNNFEAHIDIARAYARLGNALIHTGEQGQGREFLCRAIMLYGPLVQKDTENALLQRDFAQAAGLLAEAVRIEQPKLAAVVEVSAEQAFQLLKAQRRLSAADLTSQ